MVTITVIVPMAETATTKRHLPTKEVAETTPDATMQQAETVNHPSLRKNQEPPGQVPD